MGNSLERGQLRSPCLRRANGAPPLHAPRGLRPDSTTGLRLTPSHHWRLGLLSLLTTSSHSRSPLHFKTYSPPMLPAPGLRSSTAFYAHLPESPRASARFVSAVEAALSREGDLDSVDALLRDVPPVTSVGRRWWAGLPRIRRSHPRGGTPRSPAGEDAYPTERTPLHVVTPAFLGALFLE
jgi:hypothetical protein